MLHENEANQLITCRFSKFLIQLCKKKRFLWGFVLKYYFLGGSCRNITVPRYWASEVLCRALFRGCAEILVLRRNIHLCTLVTLLPEPFVPLLGFKLLILITTSRKWNFWAMGMQTQSLKILWSFASAAMNFANGLETCFITKNPRLTRGSGAIGSYWIFKECSLDIRLVLLVPSQPYESLEETC